MAERSNRRQAMQNIHVKRYSHPEDVGWAASIEPEDGSWILFIPLDEAKMPSLFIEVEVPEEEDADLTDKDVKTIKGYTPAIYLDDRVTVKEGVVE
jgi:hypothetical protein